MLKALVVGDCHFCDYVPVKRIDNFLEAQFIKIDRIKSIAEERSCDAIILLGDVFDKARPEMWLVNRVMDSFKDSSCVVMSVTGNHDLQGCRDGVPSTALGNMFTSGVFKRMDGDSELLGIPIRTINHTREHRAALYATDTPRIIFTHNMVTPQVAPFEHVFVDDVLSAAKNCFIFAGDFHPPFEKQDLVAKSHIINPGVLTRTSIAEKDIDPSVIYFEATPEDLVVYHEKISLGCPKGELIFDIAAHEKIKSDEFSLKGFIDSINQTQFESQDIEKLIQEVGTASKVSSNIIIEAINRIKVAKTLA
jgi:predicted phosphodiesterase